MAVGLLSGKIAIYDTSKSLTKTLSAHTDSVGALKTLTNGRMASGSTDTYVKVWNTTSWSLISSYCCFVGGAMDIIQIDDDTIAAARGSSNPDTGSFTVWSISKNKTIRSVALNYWGISLLLLPNKLIASGDGNGNLQFWNYTSSTYDVPIMTKAASAGKSIFDIVLIDSQYLATGARDYYIKIWDYSLYTSVTLYKTLSGHTNTVSCLSLLSSQYLVSGSMDKSVRVWDLTTYTQYTKLTSTSYIYAVDYFTDSVPISVDYANQLIYWNMTSAASLKTKTTASVGYSLATF